MKTLNIYIIKRIAGPFFLGLSVLLMVLSLERVLRLMQAVNERNAPVSKVFELIIYLIPHYLGLAVPAALFLAILLAARRLLDDSELAVMQSAGISLRSLYKPILLVVVPATVFLLLLSGFIQPQTRYIYRTVLHEMAAENPLGDLRPRVFHTFKEGLVMRVENIKAKEEILENIFISREKKDTHEQVLISAQQGKLTQDTETAKMTLMLEKGVIIRDNKNTKASSSLAFDTYPWEIPGVMDEPYGLRGRDEREMNFFELINGRTAYVIPETSPAKVKAEFHARVVQSLSLLFLALWALPLAIIGGNRTGKAVGLVLGGGLLVFYEKILGLGETYVAKGAAHVGLALWLPWFVLGIGGVVAAFYLIPEHLKYKNKSAAS